MRLTRSALCLIMVVAGSPLGWTQSRARPPKPIAPRPLSESRPDAAAVPSPATPRVALEIGSGEEYWGRIVLELNPAKAPQTVDNFLRHVDAGYYDGTIFHRVLPNFLIQGGGYDANGQPKRPAAQRPLRSEANNGLKNTRGTVAMARGRNPHSATTQFFINVVDNPKLDHPGHDGWGYCVFGQVVEGMPVVDRICRIPTRAGRSGGDTRPSWPVSPPVIHRAYRLTVEPEAEAPASSTVPPAQGEPEAGPEPADEVVPMPVEEPPSEEPETQPVVPHPDAATVSEL